MNERQSVIFPLRVCGFIVITLEKEVVSQLGQVKCPKVQLCKLNLDELLVLYTMKTKRKILAIEKLLLLFTVIDGTYLLEKWSWNMIFG